MKFSVMLAVGSNATTMMNVYEKGSREFRAAGLEIILI